MKRGLLFVNLGSPDSPSVPDVRRYLKQFLMDGDVLDIPYPLRWLLVHVAILPSRPKRSAAAYKTVWTAEGSPLITTSRKFVDAVRDRLPEMPIALGMRYGNPSIESGIEALEAAGVDSITVFPLYPHYAASSVRTVTLEVARVIRKRGINLPVHVVPPFYNDPAYLDCLANSARPYISDIDHLLVSYHGLPERHLIKTDPTKSHCLSCADCCSVPSPAHATCYRHQCFETTRLLVERLNLAPDKYSVSFQSRLGRDPWLRPFTDEVLVELAQSGVKRLAVICPAFVADCLETLEEIGEAGRHSFLEAGGESFQLIPCLNTNSDWVKEAAEICVRFT